jgi:hypothetical protein
MAYREIHFPILQIVTLTEPSYIEPDLSDIVSKPFYIMRVVPIPMSLASPAQ